MAKPSFRAQVAEELIRHIEAGTAPWQKPWDPNVVRTGPFNPTTGKPYRGINAWWLDLQGYSDPRWMTYRQAQAADAQVRKREKGTLVEYWKWRDRVPVLDEDGQPVTDDNGKTTYQDVRLDRPKVFHAVVFNAEQIDGLAPYQAPTPSFDPVEQAEKVLAQGEVTIRHDQADRAFYVPARDTIHLPDKAAFKGAYEYYATALHELGHATGHQSRLARDFGPFGSDAYAKEELRAEMAAFMVATELGLGHYPERHAAYVGSWLKALKDDHNLLFTAARDAEKIRTWVMEPELRLSLRPQKEQAQDLRMVAEHRRSEVLLSALGRFLRHEADLVTRTQGDVTQLTLEGAELAQVTGEVTQDKAIEALANSLRDALRNEGRSLPSDLRSMSLDQFTVAYRVGKIIPEFEVVAQDIGSVVQANTDGLLEVNVRELYERVQAQPLTPERGRTYLDVPFAEKDQAKAAGAKWDRERKSWYVPEGVDPAPLAKWVPAAEQTQGVEHAAPERSGSGRQEDKAMAEKRDRVYLTVPYAEKDQAKAAGAKWDRRRKSWYAPDGVDMEPLNKWLPTPGRAQAAVITPEAPSPEEEFAEALRDNGLVLDGPPQMDGKWHRVPVEGDAKGKKSGSYRGFLDGRPAGQIMNYKTGEQAVQWVATGTRIDPAERDRLKAEAAARKAELEREQRAQHRQVAKRAYGLWMNATPAAESQGKEPHPYLAKKEIGPGELRQDDKGNLLVPMRDTKGFLWNLQVIQPDGTKRYLKGGRKTGLMHVIEGKAEGPMLVAEGYATAASLNRASRLSVAVAFDAGNLEPVAKALKAKNPDRELVIAADDDHAKTVNAGLKRGRAAAEAVEGKMIAPPLTVEEKRKGLTDFNDLMRERGVKGLATALMEELNLTRERRTTRSQARKQVRPPSQVQEPQAMAL